MKTKLLPMRQVAQALALAGLVSVAGHAGAADVYLCAKPVNLVVPGGGTVPMWGFASDNAAGDCSQPATVPGPAISIPANETALNVYLKNTLTTPVSIVINGQPLPATTGAEPVWTDSSLGKRFVDQQNPTPTELAKRVRSLVHETAPGAIGVYNFSGVKPGTYLYHSGTHPQVQVQMGLYGGMKKDFAVGEAYSGVTYSNEVTLLYSEIDPALHAAVATDSYGPGTAMPSTLNYQPRYFLINGKAFVEPLAGDPPVPALATLTAGQPTLLRFINAGLQTHVPVINGMSMRLIAEDGNPYPWPANPREQYSVLLPAAKTIDAIIVPHAVAGGSSARYAIYDRMMGLSNDGAANGGMLAFLDVGSGGNAPEFTSSAVTAATQGVLYNHTLTATDADGGTLSYSLDTSPTGMNVDASNGLIAWTPSAAQIGNQAVTARVTDPTGLFATQSFSITVADVNDPPLAQNDGYSLIQGGTLNVSAPGVLGNDSDPDPGDTLTAVNFSAASNGTLAGNASGSFVYTPAIAFTGTASFSYQAQDGSSATSNVATVSVTVNANKAPVAVDDTFSAPVRRSTPPYVPQILTMLANDSDPDTAIDPTNVIDPATVVISTAPNKGGSLTVNANGTITYTPKLNFRGTEVFRYQVRDNLNAQSNAATVRVNVQ